MNKTGFITIRRKLPQNLIQDDLRLFQKALERNIPSPVVDVFANVKITGSSVIYKGIKVFPESFIEPSRADKYKSLRLFKFIVKNNFFRKRIRVKVPVIWFADEWSFEYFHWLTDALPRLFLVKDRVKEAWIMLPEKYKDFGYIQQSLLMFEANKVIYLPERAVAVVDKMIFPNHTAPTGNYNEDLIRELNKWLLQNSRTNPGVSFGQRIYISRRKSLRRKVANEDEIIPLLEKYSFTILCFEDYSFEEQVSIISSAKYLISNHGAGLTNMLFMSQGSKVFELRRENDDHNNCYFALSSALGHDYFYQNCKAVNNETDTFTADLIVNKELFEENIRLLTSS